MMKLIILTLVLIGLCSAADKKPNLSEIAVRPRVPPKQECREDCDRRISYEAKKKIEECVDLGALPALCNLQGRAHENDGRSKCSALQACSLRGIPIRYGIGK